MGGGKNTHYQASNYNAGYEYGKTGGAFSFPEKHPEYQYFKAGYDKAIEESKPKENPLAGMMEMMAGMMESMRMPEYSEEEKEEVIEPDPDQEYMDKYGVTKAQYTTDTTKRDKLFTDYMDAAGTATDYITSEIDRERANAALLGIDYSITDEQKSTRINDYFASMWGEGTQAELETLITKYGNPTGFDGNWTVKRGTGASGQTASTGDTTLATSQTAGGGGSNPATLVEEEEEDTLG